MRDETRLKDFPIVSTLSDNGRTNVIIGCCVLLYTLLYNQNLDSIVIVIVIGCLKIEDGGNIGKTMFLCTVISTDGGASR